MKTRILPTKVYVLTSQEEYQYIRKPDEVIDRLTERLGELVLHLLPEDDDTEVQRPDGRVVGRFRQEKEENIKKNRKATAGKNPFAF